MSCPAACASGPVWPQPVMRPKTSFGLRAATAAGPNPRRSITPGRKPSIKASADSSNCQTKAWPSADFRLTAIERLPRCPAIATLPGRQSAARSMTITSAPISANNMPAIGPGPMPANSITRSPDSGPGPVLLGFMGLGSGLNGFDARMARRCRLRPYWVGQQQAWSVYGMTPAGRSATIGHLLPSWGAGGRAGIATQSVRSRPEPAIPGP